MNDFHVGSNQAGARPARRRVPMIAVLAALVAFWFVSRPPGVPPGWGSDFDAGLKQAAAEGKNLLIAFHSDGCPPCLAMDKTVLRADVIQKAVTRFVPVRVNVSQSPQVAMLFQIEGTPTYAILSPEGKLLAQTSGYRDEEDMLRFLKTASVTK